MNRVNGASTHGCLDALSTETFPRKRFRGDGSRGPPPGPYRWFRDPIYPGGATLLAGFGLWHRSLSMTLFAGV